MRASTVIFAVMLLSAAALVYCRGNGPHQFKKHQCGICHDTDKGVGIASLKENLTASCKTCHTDLEKQGYMHPVDIRPKKVKVPPDFPLSAAGTLTCATCHDPHEAPERPFGGRSKFLRRFEKGKAFCDICHMNTDSMMSGHNTVFRRAHLGARFTETDDDMQIDTMSRNCLTCHDGTVGPSVTLNAGVWRHEKNFIDYDHGGMHPIGMSYSEMRQKNRMAALRPLPTVDKRIRFFDGDHVGCGSCHDPYSTLPKKLVMKNERSALCLACHKMSIN